MMRALIATAALSFTPTALADYFQIYDGTTPYYVPHAPVLVNQREIGSTDAMGRIRIDLPAGHYEAEIVDGVVRRRISFSIDGSGELKILRTQ